MKGLAELIKTTLIGGLLVVLPIYLSVLLLAKTLGGLLSLLSPVTAAIPADAGHTTPGDLHHQDPAIRQHDRPFRKSEPRSDLRQVRYHGCPTLIRASSHSSQ